MTMTNKNCFSRLVVGCTLVLLLAACGGGGDGDGGVVVGIPATREATLTLGQEVPAAIAPTPPATNPITGTMTVTLAANNAVSGTLTLAGDFGRVTAAHIHDGIVGVAGPVKIGLQKVGDGSSWSIAAGTSLDATQAASFRAGSYYVNAHTDNIGTTVVGLNPAGEIRGQLIGFADNIQPIFTNSCAISGCHRPNVIGNPMSLVAGDSVASLVGQAATVSLGGGTRVIAGDSLNSVLVKRITGILAGQQMPPGGLLPQNDQNLIKVWIDMGAKNN
jgi:hypothetical protein